MRLICGGALTLGLGALAVLSTTGLWGCSSSKDGGSDEASGGTAATAGDATQSTGGSGTPGGGGMTSEPPSTVVGSFSVVLNPPIEDTGAFTSVSGTVFTGVYPSDVIETPRVQNDDCTVYEFSVQSCTNPACATDQACVATDTCQDKPSLVSLGAVTLSGIGGADLKLSAINNNYQYAGEITYPGFAEGDTITLSAAGGDPYPAQTISTTGVAPLVLAESAYTLSTNTPLELRWTPGSAAVGAKIAVILNISKHGGSSGYIKCEVEDTGSLTVPAEQITALMNLGVAGFPELLLIRSTQGESSVSTGTIVLNVASRAQPSLAIEGYCSCFDSGDCGSCSDTTKTTCNSVTKLCYAP